MKHVLALIVALLLGGGLAGPAAAHGGHELLVPRPDCIQTILNADTGVPADDCLARTATFDAARTPESQRTGRARIDYR